eukprot:11609674-Alexandrium_andersonii.AAC.1
MKTPPREATSHHPLKPRPPGPKQPPDCQPSFSCDLRAGLSRGTHRCESTCKGCYGCARASAPPERSLASGVG